MKVKEIARTANIAWSPASHHPIYLAAGTAAQQLDATFRYALIIAGNIKCLLYNLVADIYCYML